MAWNDATQRDEEEEYESDDASSTGRNWDTAPTGEPEGEPSTVDQGTISTWVQGNQSRTPSIRQDGSDSERDIRFDGSDSEDPEEEPPMDVISDSAEIVAVLDDQLAILNDTSRPMPVIWPRAFWQSEGGNG